MNTTTKRGRRKPVKVFQTRAITGVRFRETRFACGLSADDAAKFLQVTPRTLHNWESGSTRVPYAAYKLLRVLRGGFLPGKPWRGFRVYGDSLYTPEGHRFPAADLAWWSLTCRRASAFGSVMAQLRAIAAPGSIARAAADDPAQPPSVAIASLLEIRFGLKDSDATPAGSTGDLREPVAMSLVPTANRGLKSPASQQEASNLLAGQGAGA